MNAQLSGSTSLYSKVIDFIVLTVSFLVLALITDFTKPMQVFIDLSLYVFIMYFCLRICKHFVLNRVHTSGPIIASMFGNICGLIVGVLSVLTFNYFFPGLGESALVVIFSSILAFFILGTLSPMVKSSNNDILHH